MTKLLLALAATTLLASCVVEDHDHPYYHHHDRVYVEEPAVVEVERHPVHEEVEVKVH